MWCCIWPLIFLGCCCNNNHRCRRRNIIPDNGFDRVTSVTGSYFPQMNIYHGTDPCIPDEHHHHHHSHC